MKETPILYSQPMITAILNGSKSVTRRIVKPQPKSGYDKWHRETAVHYQWENESPPLGMFTVKCPYGEVGDLLWVKETHYKFGRWITIGTTKSGKKKWKFVACTDEVLYVDTIGDADVRKNSFRKMGWYKRSSLFMHKRDSRLRLKITDIIVERLQEITDVGAIREGIETNGAVSPIIYRNYLSKGAKFLHSTNGVRFTAENSFATLWQSINGYESWDSNPWVFVVSFERIKE